MGCARKSWYSHFLLSEAHDCATSGHFGEQKTVGQTVGTIVLERSAGRREGVCANMLYVSKGA